MGRGKPPNALRAKGVEEEEEEEDAYKGEDTAATSHNLSYPLHFPKKRTLYKHETNEDRFLNSRTSKDAPSRAKLLYPLNETKGLY